MNSDQIGGVVRAVMTFFAGWAVEQGISNEQWLALGGGITALLAILWSLYTNSNRKMINTVADQEDVHKVVVKDPGLVLGFDNPKVTAK